MGIKDKINDLYIMVKYEGFEFKLEELFKLCTKVGHAIHKKIMCSKNSINFMDCDEVSSLINLQFTHAFKMKYIKDNNFYLMFCYLLSNNIRQQNSRISKKVNLNESIQAHELIEHNETSLQDNSLAYSKDDILYLQRVQALKISDKDKLILTEIIKGKTVNEIKELHFKSHTLDSIYKRLYRLKTNTEIINLLKAC